MDGNIDSQLERGRRAYRRRAWDDAYRALSAADQTEPLSPDDLEMLAWSAALLGRDSDFLGAHERIYHMRFDCGERLPAARSAFWLGFRLFSLGEIGRATGWLSRAQRIVEEEGGNCVERGYLLLPLIYRNIQAGDYEAAFADASTAVEIGNRFREPDLVAFARSLQGRAMIRQGRVEEGMPLLDEAMLTASSGELSPLVTGLVYCSVIAACQQIYALDRAREWTQALSNWCETQPQLIMFNGRCLVHRAEIMEAGGNWAEAVKEARRAADYVSGTTDRAGAAAALYQEAEIYRLRGEFATAEQAYMKASELGMEPQPGLALLRLSQGCSEAAAGAIRRFADATNDRLQRIRLLPAYVEIMLAVGSPEEAAAACRELEEIAAHVGTEVLTAIADHARGAVELAAGEARAALAPLSRAFAIWDRVEAPYLAARIRVLLALACRALGDDEGSALALSAARAVFERLGAAPDLARIDALMGRPNRGQPHCLTARELQVLRLVAAGKTNRAIAGDLHLSEKTVDRHVSNIFTKLDVPSRAAATAHAYEQKLI